MSVLRPRSYRIKRATGTYCPRVTGHSNCAFLAIAQLNARGQGTFRLPTDAEWELACRAGASDKLGSDLGAGAWLRENSEDTIHPVGQKEPNAYGLYDMIGKVSQWCQDRFGDYPKGPVTDPQGPSWGSKRVVRGAEYSDSGQYLTSVDLFCRMGLAPDYRGRIGLRLLMTQP